MELAAKQIQSVHFELPNKLPAWDTFVTGDLMGNYRVIGTKQRKGPAKMEFQGWALQLTSVIPATWKAEIWRIPV
jgi:hypothetical protein